MFIQFFYLFSHRNPPYPWPRLIGAAPVLGRGHPLGLLEQIGEIVWILVAHLLADQAAALAGAAQEFLCLVHTIVCQIFDKALSGLLAEDHAQMVW